MKDLYRTTLRKTAGYFYLLFILTLLLPYQAIAASNNTTLSGDDQAKGPFPIGFNFKLYDREFTQFYATTNGLIQFDRGSTLYRNTCLPNNVKNSLLVFWDDLQTDVSGQPDGQVKYETLGEKPNRKLIVQWDDMYFYDSKLPMGSFQAVLYEQDGGVKYQYRSLTNAESRGKSATIGLSGVGDAATQFSCNQARAIASQQAILFTPDGKGGYSVNERADYDFIDVISLVPSMLNTARYTNSAPQWRWNKNSSLNSYEIEIQDALGHSLLTQTLGDVNAFTYGGNVASGEAYQARVRGRGDSHASWGEWSAFSPLTTIDTVAPEASVQDFRRSGNSSATVTYSASDALSGIGSVALQIATDALFSNIVLEQETSGSAALFRVEGLPPSDTLFARVRATDQAGNTSEYSAAQSVTFAAPQLIAPVTGTLLHNPTIDITAATVALGEVQVYINDLPVGPRVSADAAGRLVTPVTLSEEGSHRIALDVRMPYGVSAKSAPIALSYQMSLPNVLFVTPADGAQVSAPVDIDVTAVDEQGIDRVELFLDGNPMTTMTAAPYRFHWDMDGVTDGQYELQAVAINSQGQRSTVTRSVEVKLAGAAIVTPYFGQIDTVAPTLSYGSEPIVISGRAVERVTTQPVANTALKLVLTVKGFQRHINLVTDADGAFQYRFMPQSNDNGVYQVAAIHPLESEVSAAGEFTIDQVNFAFNRYTLQAARGIPTAIQATAAANGDTQGLRWVLRASDQPEGRLPQGIQIDGGSGINIDARKSATLQAWLTADDAAMETGTLVLTALANTSGEQVRGRLQVDYRLTQAEAGVYTQTPVVETGVKQGEMVTEEVILGNRGLITAENVSVHLLDESGNPPPAWMFLASNPQQGALKVGDSLTLSLVAQPGNDVSDGIYRFRLHVSADNSRSGTVPVSVSVLQRGEGTVRFDVADIYTATLDDDGLPILGVNGARITLQNEAALTDVHTLTTDKDGIASLDKLSPGIYRYRASAKQHMDASGQLRVLPGVTRQQHIFLDYQTVNIEFSVKESTVEDVYDVVLEATYNTKVPAPVVVFEPLSISLSGMQIGEERIGQLVLVNYGLVQADRLTFSLPQSDERFRYEFFGEIPDVLPAKSRFILPYRVTALNGASAESHALAIPMGAQALPELLPNVRSTRSGQCDAYSRSYSVRYQNTCANGDIGNGSAGGNYNDIKGNSCVIGGALTNGHIFGGSASSSSPFPMVQQCTKDCSNGRCCKSEGNKSANK